MTDIVRPVTDDGNVGYDRFDQLVWERPYEYGGIVMSHIADVREKTCVICERGWEPTGPSMGDQIRWEIVDALVHQTCYIRHQGLGERADFHSALVAARVRFHGLKTRPNGYWPESDPWAKKPWYYAELMDHPVKFVLGTRKNVNHIQIVPQGGTKLNDWKKVAAAFEQEDVTKEFSETSCLIHAWGDKTKSYIDTIVRNLSLQIKR